ncbi:diguanylate cyclase [Miltoncostaea oceani]|uniref:diguanylate cyclase n=1 Tax=Miltoncostaea oceani TaxID=2843216 RepID=UPI001C3C7CE6|nr:diguanylate cyclase [Miltoncostaea oceani]
MDSTLAGIASAAQRTLGSDRASCFVHDGEDVSIVAVHTTATDPRERSFLERSVGRPLVKLPICRLLVEQSDPLLVVEDIQAEGRIPAGLASNLGSGAFVGLRLEHPTILGEAGTPALLGTLFMSFRSPQRIPERAISVVRSLGGLAALAIANARLHASVLISLAEAQQRAAGDPLTGLANHRTFHEALQREAAHASETSEPLSVVLIDLDHFKQVNDTYGHQRGDRVLQEVAARLRSVVRAGEVVARVGGEEFGWILPGTDAQTAVGAAERARAAISEEIEDVGVVNASAGVCDLGSATDVDHLLELADGALYWAKAHGRDTAVMYCAEVVTELSAAERAERLEVVRAMAGLRALARAVDAKDPSTRRHSERVADLAGQLAGELGWPRPATARLREAGLLHDVGKIGVPDAVLFKPGPLTPSEYEQVKQHSPLGANIAAEVLDGEQVAWIRHHHERWNGGGYPDGLCGPQAPEGAQILALADAWDVMTSARSYKRPLATQQALAECRRESGRQFAPAAVEALERLAGAGALTVDADAPDAEVITHLAALELATTTEFASACQQAICELRAATGWEEAFITRIQGDQIEIIGSSGSGLISPGGRFPLTESFCHRMIEGLAPASHSRLSDADSGYSDLRARDDLGLESYSGHPILLPDGSVFGTLCVIDRQPRVAEAAGRELGDALARLLAWEVGRESALTAVGRARASL